MPPALPLPEHPRLAQNIVYFARALRRAGMPIGPGRVIDAVRAIEAAGFSSRDDFYWALHACFVARPEHRLLFAQTFRLFWRDPRFLEHMMALMLPMVRGAAPARPPAAAERRASSALVDQPPEAAPAPGAGSELAIDASRTASAAERLRQIDFEQMSPAEAQDARRLLASMALPVPPLLSRRYVPGRGAAVDRRQTLRQMMRRGGDIGTIARRQRRTRPPRLVVLCDISGSMAEYSRAILHFAHGAANAPGGGWAAVHGFTFGTRLTNITRHLAHRDVDAALAAASAEAPDWEGGTRIGASLAAFNRDWSRRVLGQGAVVLLITDGLEREAESPLAAAAQRLRLSCRHLIWINPLLRYDGFAPRAAGVRALLPHVDSLRAGHNIAALEGLVAALMDSGAHGRMMRALAAQPDPKERP